MVEGPVTCDSTKHLRIRDHTTRSWRYVGTAFGHVLLGSHNFMVTALGSCVKLRLRRCIPSEEFRGLNLHESMVTCGNSVRLVTKYGCTIAKYSQNACDLLEVLTRLFAYL